GFESLGLDYDHFHSYLCKSLETDCVDKLGIKINKYGRFDSFEDCEKATDYIALDSIGAEPVCWFSWCVREYPLNAS
ncbi:MAG: hypothetical protein ACYTF7_07465, partial [Planctomycetota bacterium]